MIHVSNVVENNSLGSHGAELTVKVTISNNDVGFQKDVDISRIRQIPKLR